MSLISELTRAQDDPFFDKEFMSVIDAHMGQLRRNKKVVSIQVDDFHLHLYRGLFYDYLAMRGVPLRMYWVLLRLNQMNSPDEFSAKHKTLLMIESNVIETYRQSWAASVKIRI